MINLLPYEVKQDIRAARMNVTLIRYIVVLAIGMVFLAVIAFGVYTILMDTKASAENAIKDNQAKTSSYASVRDQASTFRTQLSLAKTILDKETRYSKVITGIAALMPAGTVLDSLALSPTSFGAPTTLTVYAKTTADALAVKDSFQSSSLFSNVSFTALSNSAQSKDYPITASLTVTINKGAAQ